MWRGRLTAHGLNRVNHAVVLAGVTATGLEAGQVAADLGFGGGVGLRPLLDRIDREGHVQGVELSGTMLAMARGGSARTRHMADTLNAGGYGRSPLADDSIDAAITVNTVYLVEDLEQAFDEIARVLRPDGRVVIGGGDLSAMSAMPFAAHASGSARSTTSHPLRDTGFSEPGIERVGNGERAFHLLVADRAVGR